MGRGVSKDWGGKLILFIENSEKMADNNTVLGL